MDESSPAQVGSNAGLGSPPARVAFEAWFSDGGKNPLAVERVGESYKLMQAHSAWAAWSRGAIAERERCAAVCESEARLWESDGKGPAIEARLCAARIRAFGPNEKGNRPA